MGEFPDIGLILHEVLTAIGLHLESAGRGMAQRNWRGCVIRVKQNILKQRDTGKYEQNESSLTWTQTTEIMDLKQATFFL